MTLPTSVALSSHVSKLEKAFPGLWSDLLELRRLQHEATLDSVKPKVRVLDFEAARRLREEAGMACHDDTDPAA